MTTTKSIRTVLDQIESALSGNLEKPVQEELANLVLLLHDLEQDNLENLVPAAKIATSALLLPEPEIEMAKRIRSEIVRRRSGPALKSPAVLITMGLGLILYIGIPLTYVLFSKLAVSEYFFGLKTSILLLVGIAGAFGSIVSIMVRIQDFSTLTNVNKYVLAMTGFFKPIIGTTFALFIYATIEAGMLPVKITEGKELFFFIAVAFIAGFSEIWDRDIATKTEGTLSVTPKT